MEHFGAEGGLPFSAAAGQPLALKIANLSGRRELRQLHQRPLQYRLVARALMRRAECSPDRMIHESRARRYHFAYDVVSRANNKGRNAARFDHVAMRPTVS